MNPNFKAFYAFLAAVLAVVIAFGIYVSRLTDCNASSIGPLDCHRLYLAFGVLFAIVVMLIVGAGLYALLPPPATGEPPGKAIFDGFIKVLPPIATLVLGYYFGSTQTTPKSAEPRVGASAAVEPTTGAAAAGSSSPARK